MEMEKIQIREVCKTFGKKEARVQALRGVTLSIQEGEMAAIMGKSGSGKSTLLNILGGMMSMDSGEYLYDGSAVNFKSQRDLTRFRRNEIGFVVQYFALGGGHLGRLRPFLHGPGEHVAYPARRLDLFHTVQLSDGCRQRGKPLDIIAVAQHKQSLRDAVGKPHPAVEVGIAAAALDEIHERFGAYFKGNVGMKILHKPISENRFVDRWENGLSMD